jgi:hypothetical protein
MSLPPLQAVDFLVFTISLRPRRRAGRAGGSGVRRARARRPALVWYDFRDNHLNIINYLWLFTGSCGASRAGVRLRC